VLILGAGILVMSVILARGFFEPAAASFQLGRA
jgi:hypothetical protein